MGPLGVQETVVIFVLALLIFGPKKLPELGRTIGKAMTEFRRASSDLKASFDREMSTIERENESLREVTRNYMGDTLSAPTYNHDNYYDSGAYAPENLDSTANNPSPVSASAPQGAENTVQADTGNEEQPKPAPSAPKPSETVNS